MNSSALFMVVSLSGFSVCIVSEMKLCKKLINHAVNKDWEKYKLNIIGSGYISTILGTIAITAGLMLKIIGI